MGKKIKLYKCNAMVIDESKTRILGDVTFNNIADVVTEYLFAGSKTEATNIFGDRYKNKYNSNIEDNELTLTVERSDNK